MASILADLRDAVRVLRHAPGYSLLVSLTLALGIGVNTAMFSVVDAALFRPLPYPEADRLVRVAEWPKTGGNYTVAPSAFLDFRAHSRAFTGFEASVGGTVALLGSGEPQELRASRVTPGYFDLLGVRALHGRLSLGAGDASDPACRAVISHDVWTARLGSPSDVVGRVLRLDAGTCTVIGVLPAGAMFNRAASDVYLLRAIGQESAQLQGRVLTVTARLAPGLSIDQARDELSGVAATFNATRGSAGRGWTIALTPLDEVLVRADTRRLAWILLATVACVLLVACVNVAGLSLSRMLDRRREIAVRAALGATRARIIRALLTEGLVLGAAGGLLALIAGAWTLRLFTALMPAGLLPAAGAAIDSRAFLFTGALALATGVLFGLLPAWQGATASAVEALAAGGRTMSASRTTTRLRGALVVVEVALATTVLIGAVLLAASFSRLSHVDPGFSPERVLTFRLTLPSGRYGTDGAVASGFDRILDEVRSVPGVALASAVTSMPLGGWLFGAVFTIDGAPPAPDRPTSAHIQSIARDYFRTLAIPIAQGREFVPGDTAGSAPVAIVNATFAARYVGEGRVLGRHVEIDGVSREIVGVARDVKTGGLADAPLATPEIYVPHEQSPVPTLNLVVASANEDPHRLAPSIRAAVGRVDAALPIGRMQTMDERVDGSVDTPRFRAVLIGTFALLAALLASLGVYAVRAQAVASRRREIGVRMALGATRFGVVRLVVMQSIWQVGAGLLIGVVAARWLMRVVEPWLFATRTGDPLLIGAVVAALLVAALVASWGPARRAASIEPLVALRD